MHAQERQHLTRSNLELESVESLYPFVLTEDQEHLRREIREFAAREIAPNVMAWDEASEFPMAMIKKLGAMGLMGVIVPPKYGGAGLATWITCWPSRSFQPSTAP
jgi:alkylation response protein AidB-like acyl-CoA dehydrogenase